jgi:hypothetical protein
MKRILFVALSATLLAAGCQETKIINQVNPTGEPSMTFTTSMGKLTKASGTSDAEGIGIDNLRAQDFRVWVYGEEDFDFTANVQDDYGYDEMLNLLVEYRGQSIGWGTHKQHFWPGKDKKLKFFAVSADADFLGLEGYKAASESPVVPNPFDKSMVIKGFVSTDGDYNTDLMVADYVQQDQDGNGKLTGKENGKTVDLTFRHALSKIQFAFNTVHAEGINVFVQKVAVKGLKTKANLTVTYKEGDGQDAGRPIYKWEHSDSTAVFVDDWETMVEDGSGFPELIEGHTVSDADKKSMKITSIKDSGAQPDVFTTWLVLPQEVEDKKVEITYLMNERQFLATFNLAYDALRQTNQPAMWNDNQFVRYVVTLAPNLISFNPEVGEWDDANDLTNQN